MEDYFAAQAIAIAAGRKYAQSGASEKNKTEEGGKKRKEKSVSAQPDGPNDGPQRWG